MTYIRRLILALALSAGLAPAFAQVPPPVPALPDTERRTSYSISASTCACSVGFALYGDSTDYANWIEVFVNGVRMAQAGNWTLSSATGTIGSIPLPITNAVLTFTAPQTGTIQIVGARRPRRTSQFNEGAGVPTRNFNVVLSDLTAQNRELWDKTNDVTGRALMSQPGNTVGLLPLPSTCVSGYLGFDATGLVPVCRSGSSGGSVTLPVISGNLACFDGTTGLLKDCTVSPTTITLPIGNITGLGTGVATFLATPTSANLAAALTNETGTGLAVFSDSPVFTTQIQDPLIIGGTAAGSSVTVKASSNGTPVGDIANINAHTVNLVATAGGTTTTVNIGGVGVGNGILAMAGQTSGSTSLIPSATASGTVTLPAATDTLVGKATTDTLTNKTFSAGGTGNVLTLRSATIQKFTTGTGATYTTPATSSFVVIKFCGPGGGGSGSGTGTTGGTGGTGTSSVFNSITCTGGAGSTASVPGVGGTCSGGSPTETWAGSPGGGVQTGIAGTFLNGGMGGGTVLFAGGSQVAGVPASGGGGGGGFFNGAGNTGGGGGGGGCATQIVAGAGATYTYTVGTAGGAGTAGTSGSVGFAGSTGYLEGVEY